MSNEAEREHKEENVAIIRAYLQGEFKGFDISEQPDYPLSYTFTVTKLKPPTQYKLKMSWPRISDGDYTPAKIKRLLINDDVAARMKAARGEYFSWGW
jgi:hypothetical protein